LVIAMQRVFLTLITALAVASTAAAESPSLQVKVSPRKIYEGESFQYSVLVDHAQNPGKPDLSALAADFDIAPLGEQSLNSTFTSFTNGKTTTESHFGRQYNYRLTPKRAGTIEIPGPTATADGQTIQGKAVTVIVQSAEQQDVVRMEIRCDRATVYPLQPFTVTLSVNVRALPSPYEDKNPLTVQQSPPVLQIPWAFDEKLTKDLKPSMPWQQWLGALENQRGQGFNVNGLASGTVFSMLNEERIAFLPSSEKVRMPDKSGKDTEYWHYEFRRTFTALKIGPMSFGPASLKGDFATEVSDGRVQGETIYAVAKPAVIQVEDVPREGRPDSYINAVGTFRFSAELEPKRVRTGDPMTLTLMVAGEGMFDTATAPDLKKLPQVADHFKIYDATAQTKGNRRLFTYSIRPLDADIREFPAVPAAYFDVDTKKYVTLQTQPIPIEVSKAVPLSERDIVTSSRSSGRGQDLKASREGIFANVTDTARLGDQSVHVERWLLGGGALGGTYLALALLVGVWRRAHSDPALSRRRAALGVAKARLSKASAEIASSHATQGAEHVLDALVGYVGDMLGLVEAGLTAAEACRKLESVGVDAEVVGRLRAILETCEGCRFGASVSASQDIGREANAILDELAAALKSVRKNGKAKSAVTACCLAFALAAFSGGCARAVDPDLVEKFEAAQQTFDNAKRPEDYAKAAMLDQEILDRWGPSGAVFYNQGNSWMQAGQPGRAVAAYRQAQRYNPRIPFLDSNLATALGDAPARKQPVMETILFWQNWLGYAEKFYAAAVAALVSFALGVVLLFRSNRWIHRLTYASLIVTAILAFSAGYDWYRFDATEYGVVIQPQTIARKGNGETYEAAFNKPLPEATEFRVVEHRGDWLLVQLPDGNDAWIDSRAAAIY
jgi:tetratricopeptide (TPR) repeat protein